MKLYALIPKHECWELRWFSPSWLLAFTTLHTAVLLDHLYKLGRPQLKHRPDVKQLSLSRAVSNVAPGFMQLSRIYLVPTFKNALVLWYRVLRMRQRIWCSIFISHHKMIFVPKTPILCSSSSVIIDSIPNTWLLGYIQHMNWIIIWLLFDAEVSDAVSWGQRW